MDTNSNIVMRIKKNLKTAKEIKVDDEEIENISDSEDEADYNEYEGIKELTEMVKKYTEADNVARNLKKEALKHNKIMKDMNDKILVHLEKMGENHINIEDGKLIKNKYKSKGSLSQDMIEESLKENFKDPKIIAKIMESIEDKKIKNEKTRIQLKRTFKKDVPKKK
jgi:hypothetical protein